MHLKQKHGLKNGKLVSIDEVESGLACGCICPCCESELVGKKGKVKAHHFAHKSEACAGALETALHLLAKEIIDQEKFMIFPPLDHPKKSDVVWRPAKKNHFTKVEVERNLGDIKPDLIAYCNDEQIYIEIAVTHFIDEEKLEKIKKRKVSTIEVDLRRLKSDYTEKDVKKALLENYSNKEWMYNLELMHLVTQFDREEIERKEEEEKRLAELKKSSNEIYNAQFGGNKSGTSELQAVDDIVSCLKAIADFKKSNKNFENVDTEVDIGDCEECRFFGHYTNKIAKTFICKFSSTH